MEDKISFTPEEIQNLKTKFAPNTVVVLESLGDDYPKPMPGDIGEVDHVDDDGQVYVYWRRLKKVIPVVHGREWLYLAD